MHHHGTGPRHYSPDDALSDAILMMGAYSTVRHGLTLHLKVVKEILCLIRMVIGAVGLDLNTIGTCEPFKCMLGLEGFSYPRTLG